MFQFAVITMIFAAVVSKSLFTLPAYVQCILFPVMRKCCVMQRKNPSLNSCGSILLKTTYEMSSEQYSKKQKQDSYRSPAFLCFLLKVVEQFEMCILGMGVRFEWDG